MIPLRISTLSAIRWACVGGVAALSCFVGPQAFAAEAASQSSAAQTLTMVVMDPLARPLSCPCVQGYAQRDYEKLAQQLESRLGRKVKLVFNESLTAALREQAEGKADLIIGKHSVVLFDAAKNKLEALPLAMLTGRDGSTTQTGLVVVPSDDPAQSVADLTDHRIIFGPPECDEKHAAALALLKKHGVTPAGKLETSAACSDGACLVLELRPKIKGAAVISSYAQPLLEGCGTVNKGDLRVIGETEPVPFIGAFTTQSVSAAERQKILDALLNASADPLLRLTLETKQGFVTVDARVAEAAKKK
jgi:ABC-type phosphate/phosphonate transport system substrate-binding protein